MTPEFKSKFLREAHRRGFIHQATDNQGLDALLHEGEQTGRPVAAYIGFDCTAPSLHVGSLMQIMLLRLWQQCGHKPVVLMGGGTTKVGDPSGRDESRKLLDDNAIEANKRGIKQVFEKYLTFGNKPGDAIMVDNADWLEKLNYIEFLRDVGRHFSVNRMLSMDSVKLRLEREQHLSFLEFNYMILQGYDFTELYRRHQCRVQFGGSDQWGNIVMGVDLHRHMLAESDAPKAALFGVTTPLLTTSSGAKMGKTASGAVWLNADMLLPYDYWQYWRNTEDADVERFLRLFTELSDAEIAALLAGNINEAKKQLATAVTTLCHGADEARKAAEAAAALFEKGGMSENMPSLAIAAAALAEAPSLAHALAALGTHASVGDARRDIEQNKCIKIDGELITDAKTPAGILKDGSHISKGKKHHWRLQLG